MKDKIKEIHQKAIENDWSGEQFAAALKEAGVTAEDVLGVQELDLEDMASVSGGEGADPATCKHKDISRWPNYKISPNKEDYGYDCKRTSWSFKCMHCGQRWSGTSPNFNFIPGWKGTVYKD